MTNTEFGAKKKQLIDHWGGGVVVGAFMDYTEKGPTLMCNLYDFPRYEILLISSSKLSG